VRLIEKCLFIGPLHTGAGFALESSMKVRLPTRRRRSFVRVEGGIVGGS
jgi:hypothetical protein